MLDDDFDVERGTNPEGGADSHPRGRRDRLPPVDPDYRQSDTADRIDRVVNEERPRTRPQTLFPYLYVRGLPGDQGARPQYPPKVFWESPDVHLVPATSGPFNFANTVAQPVAGQAYRVFVHVWNLGRMAAYGARLRAWWVEPGFFMGNDPQYTPHYIGGAYFDLGDRDSPACHRLIEIPTPWTVVMNHSAHECLMVAVECATDPWDGRLDANAHRHVAQRNLSLLAGQTDVTPLVARLGAAVSSRTLELLIGHTTVHQAEFSAAVRHGLARGGETPRGWNHSGLGFGQTTPLAAVRRDRNGLRFVDLRRPERPSPRGPAPAGTPVRELGRELPRLLQQLLSARDFSARAVATALGSRGEPRLLRFTARDGDGTVGGYSVLVVP